MEIIGGVVIKMATSQPASSSRSRRRSRKYDRMLCEHCSSFVSKSTWYMHYYQKNLEYTTSIFSETASDHETSSTSYDSSDSEPTTSKLKSSDDVSVKCTVHVA